MKAIVEFFAGIFASELGIFIAIPLGLLAIVAVPAILLLLVSLPSTIFAHAVNFISKLIFGEDFARIISAIFALIALIVFIAMVAQSFQNTDFIIGAVLSFFFIISHSALAFVHAD